MKTIIKSILNIIQYHNDKKWALEQENKVAKITGGMGSFIDTVLYELEKTTKNTMRVYSVKQVKDSHIATLLVAAKTTTDVVRLVQNKERILVETIRETDMFSFRENTEHVQAYEIL